MNQLLTEHIPFKVDQSLVTESIKTGKPLLVSGIVQKAGEKNHNGRIYERSILEREISKYQDIINDKRSLGELDHPDSSIINLNNVSHLMTKIWWEGDNVYGTAEILDTPSGRILKALFNSGISVGISSRGMGSVKENNEGILMVQEDFDLLCWDFVSTPSTKGGYMAPKSLNEGINDPSPYKYQKVHNIIRDIICDSTGMCKC